MRIKKFIPDLLPIAAGAWLTLILLISPSMAAFEKVQFESLDRETMLTAHLLRPDGAGPHPAVVMLHGCGGMGYSGTVKSIYSSWARLLTENGIAALVVDSAGPRGLGATCGPRGERRKMYRLRPFDAYGALAFLQARSDIKPDRIGLIGWSQGGGVVLLSIVEPSIGRPDPAPPHDFAAAAAFYPALCNDRVQSRPFTKVAPNSWSTRIPLLVLQGAADNWTRPEPCAVFIEAVRDRGNPVSIILYDGAYHAFDAPALKRTELVRYTTITGIVPIVQTDRAARKQAQKDLIRFLNSYLTP